MSEEKYFELNIVTPERTFFSDNVEQIIVDAIDGSRGILKDISPQIIALVPGKLSIFKDEQWREASYGKGFISTKGGSVTMLVETAEWPEEIDKARAQRDIEENEARIKSKKSYNDYIMSKANIERALARLKVKGN